MTSLREYRFKGRLSLDVACYILQLHSTEKDAAERKLKVGRFLEGHTSITRLSDEERRLLPMLGVSLYFFYLGTNASVMNWSNSFLNEGCLKRFINLLVKMQSE